MNGIFRKLSDRGYIAGFTEPFDDVQALLEGQSTIYQGFDPTADSLHLGHLQSLMIFNLLQSAGHQLIFVVGGATAQIGDPSGRDEGRLLLTPDEVQMNASSIKKQVEAMKLVKFSDVTPDMMPALMLNNGDWLDMSLITYLREVTQYFSVNEMIKRETFARRLANQQNLSLLELLYPTLQGYDFLYLFDHYNCRLQMGGMDQWGNIIDGIELVRRTRGEQVHGLFFPLLLDNKGQKMGKSSTGQKIWLDPKRTSPFDFYQYWLTCPDVDLERNLNIFTFLEISEIEDILHSNPRAVQHRLALEVTTIVHGHSAAQRAQTDSIAAFSRVGELPDEIPCLILVAEDLKKNITLPQALAMANATNSIVAGKRLVQQGGVRLNGEKICQPFKILEPSDFKNYGDKNVALVQHGRGKVLKIILGG